MGWNRDRFPQIFESDLFTLHKSALKSIATQVAQLLLAVRDGATTDDLLRHQGVVDSEMRATILRLLENLRYVRADAGRYSLLIPVFAQRDREMIDSVVAKVMEIVNTWTKDNYEHIKAELATITPCRHEVDYRETYSQVWH
jgi:hypothetical protein